MDLRGFAIARFVRLYPMIAIGAMLSGLLLIRKGFSAPVVLAFFCLPQLSDRWLFVFPGNFAFWSLFFEVCASAAFALCVFFIGKRGLVAIVLLSAISFWTAISVYGTVNVGFEVTNFAGGAPRTAFSFSLGVCLFHVIKIVKLPKTSPFIWMGLLFALLLIPFSGEEYRMLCIAVFFPTIILYAAQTEFRKSWQAPAETLGNLSYPLYATQAPIVLILRFPFSQAGRRILCFVLRYAAWGVLPPPYFLRVIGMLQFGRFCEARCWRFR